MNRQIVIYEPHGIYNILSKLFQSSFGSLFTVVSYVTGWGKPDYIENYYDTDTNSNDDSDNNDDSDAYHVVDKILQNTFDKNKKDSNRFKHDLEKSLFNYYSCLMDDSDEYVV